MLRAHLEFLADDALEGRRPGTRGGELAAKYIAAQFQRLGLEPAGDSGTYYQRVPIITLTPNPTVRIAAPTSGDLTYRKDYVLWSMRNDSLVSAQERSGVRGLWHRGAGVSVGRLPWTRCQEQDRRRPGQRPRTERLHHLPRPHSDLLRPVDVQDRGGTAARSCRHPADPHPRECHLSLVHGAVELDRSPGSDRGAAKVTPDSRLAHSRRGGETVSIGRERPGRVDGSGRTP